MSQHKELPPINPLLIGVNEVELSRLLALARHGVEWSEERSSRIKYSSSDNEADTALIHQYDEKIEKLRVIENMFVRHSVDQDDIGRTKGLEHIEEFINYLDIKAAVCYGRDLTDDGDFDENPTIAANLASQQESNRLINEIMAKDTTPRRLNDLETAYGIFAVARNRHGSYMLIEIYGDQDAKEAYYVVDTLIHVADTHGVDVNQVISDRIRGILYQTHNTHHGVYDIPLEFFKVPVTVL